MEAAANDEAAAATQPAGIMTTPPQPGQASRPAKLGSWSLDKSKVKKLGIKSSLLQALTKLNKSSTTGGSFYFYFRLKTDVLLTFVSPFAR